MKKYEYKEPEFKAVIIENEDVITTSGEPIGNLDRVTDDWETGSFNI